MSCTHNNCAGLQPVVYPPCPPTCPPVGTPNVTNINFTGVGVYDGTTSGTLNFRGVEGDGGLISTSLDAGNNAIKVSLNLSNQGFTTTFANAAARMAATPAFVGELGIQLDTGILYVATGAGVGSWGIQGIQDGASYTSANNITISMPAGGATFKVQTANADFEVDQFNITLSGAAVSITNASFHSVVEFTNNAILQTFSDGGTTPANSVLITTGTPGQVGSTLINTFLSSANTSNGYSFSNDTPLKTFDVSTIGVGYNQTVLQNLANLVVTLARDLINLKVPHA